MHLSSKSLAVVGAVFAAWLGAVAWDHAQNQTPPARSGKSGSGTANGSEVVATIDGTAITRDELDSDLIVRLNQLEDEMYEVRQEHLETIIGNRLLAAEAKRRGTTVDALVKEEIDGKIAAVTD